MPRIYALGWLPLIPSKVEDFIDEVGGNYTTYLSNTHTVVYAGYT